MNEETSEENQEKNMKKQLTFFDFILILGTVCATLFFSSCGSVPSTSTRVKATSTVVPVSTSVSSSDKSGYLYANSGIAIFLQFIEQNGTITGKLTLVVIVTNQGVESVDSRTSPFSGTHVGETISISFTTSLGPLAGTLTGTLKDDTLTLAMTLTDGSIKNVPFYTASIDDYNQALAQLKQSTQDQNQKFYDAQNAEATVQAESTAQANEQNAVQNDNDGLANALNALSNDSTALTQLSYSNALTSYTSHWTTMQNDYATEQADAAKGCGDGGYNAGVVQYQDGVVQYDEGEIQYDDGTLQYDKSGYDSDLSTINTDITNVKGWWAQLQTDVANNSTNTPAPAYTNDQINTALDNAQSAETSALNTWNAANTSAQGFDSEAAALLKQANAVPGGMHC